MSYELLPVIAGSTRNPPVLLEGFRFKCGTTVLLFLIIIILSSCENKNVDYGLDTYYVELATAQNATEFLLDNGKLIVTAPGENAKSYSFGDRVWLNYTLLSPAASQDNYSVRINGSTKIPLGKLALTNESIIRSAAKDPVMLESVWLGSHYLNLQFYIDYMSASHKIGLLADSTRLESDTIRMYFTHDINNDPPGYPSHTCLSFDLESVLGAPGKSQPVSVQINTADYGTKIYEFEY
jgi:hypothetical protein